MVGRDEVWNFRHPWYGSERAFFGDSFRARRLAAYAASFGAHDAEAGVGPEWRTLLRRFSAISVRDENSRRLVAAALGETPSLALDPCLQFPRAAAVPNAPESGEILIYGHGFPVWFQDAVRGFAVAVGAPLVSFGYQNDWADEQRIAEGPESFARAMAASRAVVTNFFHGCVFSVINRRPFAAALSPYRANKVSDLLHRLGLQSRLLDEDAPPWRYISALTEPPEAAVEERLARQRTASDRFLDRALSAP